MKSLFISSKSEKLRKTLNKKADKESLCLSVLRENASQNVSSVFEEKTAKI